MNTPAGVPPRWRLLENGHILLWLLKDTCWVLELRLGGVLMILPTLAMALFFLWKQRRLRAELFHNIAIIFWILANSTWMVGEFYDLPTRPAAAGFFLAGLSVLLVYYTIFFRRDATRAAQS